MLVATITNLTNGQIGPGESLRLPSPFDWVKIPPAGVAQATCTVEDLLKPIHASGFSGSDLLQQLRQSRKITITFVDLDPPPPGNNPVSSDAIDAEATSTGGGLPPLIGQQFAAIIENPLGTAGWSRLTEDMILPAFLLTLAPAAPTPATVEIGDTITNPNFAATYNRPPVGATLSDGGAPIALVPPFLAFTFLGVYTKTAINDTVTFTLTANEFGLPPKQVTTVLAWRPRVYFGVSAIPGGYTEAFIEGLASSALASGRARSIVFSAAAGQKLYYAFPAAFGGAPSNFLDAATNFAAGFTKVAAGVLVTNSFGVTNPYDVWESDQTGLGAVTILVT